MAFAAAALLPAAVFAAATTPALPAAALRASSAVFYELPAERIAWDREAVAVAARKESTYAQVGLLTYENVVDLLRTAESVYVDDSRMVAGVDRDYQGDRLVRRKSGYALVGAAGNGSILHDVDKRWEPVRKKCAVLTEGYGCGCSASSVITPPASQTLPVHANKHDAFLLQLAGHKRFTLYDTPQDRLLPRRDQAPSRYEAVAGVDAGSGLRVERTLTLGPGDVLFLPRGTRHAADTLQSDTTAHHVTFYLHCAEERSVHEELVHQLVALRAAALPPCRESVKAYVSPAAGYRVTYAAAFQMLVRVLGDELPVLRRSTPGIVGDQQFVRATLVRDVLPLLRDIDALLRVVDGRGVRGTNTADPRIVAWVMSGVEKAAGPVQSAAGANQAVLRTLLDHVADVSGVGERRIDAASDGFFARWAELFADCAATDRAVDRAVEIVSQQRKASVEAHLRHANTHLARHKYLREAPDIW